MIKLSKLRRKGCAYLEAETNSTESRGHNGMKQNPVPVTPEAPSSASTANPPRPSSLKHRDLRLATHLPCTRCGSAKHLGTRRLDPWIATLPPATSQATSQNSEPVNTGKAVIHDNFVCRPETQLCLCDTPWQPGLRAARKGFWDLRVVGGCTEVKS